jgi:hypothetical protein
LNFILLLELSDCPYGCLSDRFRKTKFINSLLQVENEKKIYVEQKVDSDADYLKRPTFR